MIVGNTYSHRRPEVLKTREVLKQHIKWARYQSICWKRALTPIQELPDPANWG